MTVTDLRVELTNRGLTVSGKKDELIARLLEYDAEPVEEVVEEGEDEDEQSE